jgi:hypothetical protein
MSLKRFTLPFVCALLVLGLAGAASAQTYLLGSGSGAQFQIGGGLPLPIQLTDANFNAVVDWGSSGPSGTFGPGASVFPPLLVPRKGPFVTVMGAGPPGPGQTLTVPAGVLSRPAQYKVLGVNAQNFKLYAVATNLGFKWPAAQAVFKQRTMTPTVSGTTTFFPANTMTVYKATYGTRKVTIKNTGVASPFGGAAPGNITPVVGAGLKPSQAVTVYGIAKIPTGNPPCTHPFFAGGANAACAFYILGAAPAATGAIGAVAGATVTTTGPAIVGKNAGPMKAGAVPKGTVISAAALATNTAVPTNMATSTGFFWTTGMVAVRAPGAAGTPEHFFLSGADNRTAGGAGTVSMVSGSLSLRLASGPNANRGWVRLVLSDPDKVPSISDAGLAVLTVMLLGVAVAAQLRLRRRGALA